MCVLLLRVCEKLGVCLNLCCGILRVQCVCELSSQRDNWSPQALKLRCDERLGGVEEREA